METSVDLGTCYGNTSWWVRVAQSALWIGAIASVTACKESPKQDPTSPGKSEAAESIAPTKSSVVLPDNANAIQRLLFSKAPDCFACASAKCAEAVARVFEIAGTASEGPAKDSAKSKLAQSTLSCVLDKHCVVNNSSMQCYCGSAVGVDCVGPAANGPCKSVIEAGLETTEPSKVAVNFTQPETGGGAALALVLCLVDNACKACF